MIPWLGNAKKDNKTTQTAFDANAMANRLKVIIASKTQLIEASQITDDTKLFSSGLLDSLAFIELVLLVEKESRVKLADVTEVNMNSLDSIKEILRAVDKGLYSKVDNA